MFLKLRINDIESEIEIPKNNISVEIDSDLNSTFEFSFLEPLDAKTIEDIDYELSNYQYTYIYFAIERKMYYETGFYMADFDYQIDNQKLLIYGHETRGA